MKGRENDVHHWLFYWGVYCGYWRGYDTHGGDYVMKYTLDELTEINKNINEMNSLLVDQNQDLTKLLELRVDQIKLLVEFMRASGVNTDEVLRLEDMLKVGS